MVDAAAGRTGGSGPRPLIRRGAACALLLAFAAPAAAADDGDAWLARMRAALAGLDYQGTLVYVRDGQVDALRVLHRVEADGVRERLVTETGELRDLSRKGGSTRLRGGIAMPAPGPVAEVDPALLASHYEVRLAGEDRIAALPTRIVEIRARDGFRYGYRLWLEQHTALPLKSVAYGSDGAAVEQWMFTAIALGATPSDEAFGNMGEAPPANQPPPPVPAAARYQVHDAPRGFTRIHVAVLADGGEHQVYSDGLARVSLYVEPLQASASNLSGLLRRGALSMFGRVLDGPLQVTVVGEVPPATVERIAQGVTASGGG
jgi:sigma-E factor negative regulatory protein RseB